MSTDKQAFKKDPMSPNGLAQAGSFHIWQMPGGHGSVLDAVRPPLSPRGPARSVRFPPLTPGTKPSDLKVPPFLKRKPLYPWPNLTDKNHDGSLAGVFAKMGSVLSDEQKELVERGHGVKVYKCGHESRCRCEHNDLPPVHLDEPCYDCEKQAADGSINVNRTGRDLLKRSIERGYEKQAVGANIRRAAQMAKTMLPNIVGNNWRKAVPIVKKSPTLLAEGRNWPLEAIQEVSPAADVLRSRVPAQAAKDYKALLAADPQADFRWNMLAGDYQSSLLDYLGKQRLETVQKQLQKLQPLLRRRQQLRNEQVDNLAMSGRHNKKVLPFAHDNVGAIPHSVGQHVFGNLQKKELPRTLWQKLTFQRPHTFEPGHVPENVYKGLRGDYPELNMHGLSDTEAQWLSGIPQVAQRASYADPYLWELPTKQVPKSWNWNKVFTPHVADDFSQKLPAQIHAQHANKRMYGFGNQPELDYHPMYETVMQIPRSDINAPTQLGRLFKKLPSGRAFQQLTDKT